MFKLNRYAAMQREVGDVISGENSNAFEWTETVMIKYVDAEPGSRGPPLAAYPVDSGSSICSGVGGSAPLRGLSRFMMSQ